MIRINITCDICKGVYSVPKTSEIPENVTELFCNWCSKCEDKADDYYDEMYGYDTIPDPPNPNQLTLL